MNAPSLDTMPNLAIENIMEKCDCKSVLTLRQVCKRLLYQVDHAPESSFPNRRELTLISIDVHQTHIRFMFVSSEKYEHLHYSRTMDNKCYRRLNHRERLIFEDERDLENLALKDLKLALKFLKSKVEQLSVSIYSKESFPTFSNSLKTLLKSQKLKTGKMDMICTDENDILLPYLDNAISPGHVGKLEEMVKTRQWKNAQELNLGEGFSVNVENLTNFLEVQLQYRIFTVAEVDFLRKAYSSSPNFISFAAYNSKIRDFQQLSKIWGAPVNVEHETHSWYFRCPNSKDSILYVMYRVGYDIIMTKIVLDQVPRGAIIREF